MPDETSKPTGNAPAPRRNPISAGLTEDGKFKVVHSDAPVTEVEDVRPVEEEPVPEKATQASPGRLANRAVKAVKAVKRKPKPRRRPNRGTRAVK